MDHADRTAELAAMPSAGFFGFRLLERTDRTAEVALSLREEFLQVERVVHGGVVSALADTAAVHLLLDSLPDDRSMTSVEFKLNFLRPALPDRGDLLARAELVRRGRTIALADVEVEQGGRAVAKGLFTYLLFDRPTELESAPTEERA